MNFLTLDTSSIKKIKIGYFQLLYHNHECVKSLYSLNVFASFPIFEKRDFQKKNLRKK